MSDYVIRATAADGEIRAFASTTRDLVEEARKAHNTSPVATAALGRLLTAGVMMGIDMKGEKDLLTLKIQGDGPIGGLTVTADSLGNVKGYAFNPMVMLPPNSKGKLDVGGAVGREGTLTVIKNIGLKEPYVGQVPLVSGEIAEDLTSYYATSEQIPTVCALGVLVERDLTIKKAGGYLLQLLPGATEQEISMLEQNVSRMKSMTELLCDGKTPYEIAEAVLEGFSPNVLDESEVQYHCDCSRDRVERAYMSLGQEELRKIAAEQETVELKCQFCNKAYHFRAADYVKPEEAKG